jgi:hypothetical protein
MRVGSVSTLTIAWHPPDLEQESWEFSHHPAKQFFYRRHSVTWAAVQAAQGAASLVPYPRGANLDGTPILLSYPEYEDYLTFVARAKRGYRNGYVQLERDLQQAGSLRLPAPIVLVAAGEGLLFSGYRRLCLAWNYGMIPSVWRINLPIA